MSRFDYVRYDEFATDQQISSKLRMDDMEAFIETRLKSPRAKAIALTKLEECYMWIGKAIRDDQIARNGSAPLQEKEKTDDAQTQGY